MDFNVISNDIAIDLGTSNIRIYIKGRGLVVDEPSVLACDTISGEVIAAGSEAEKMIGRTPPGVLAVNPICEGVISDCALAEELLKIMIRRVCPKTFIKPRMILSVHSGTTDVERRALRDAAIIAGARKVYIIESPIAAGIGAKCDVTLARGMMLIDFGGGRCDIATVSGGQVVAVNTHKIAGKCYTDAIISYLKDRHSLSVGYLTAERCKIEAGCVYSKDTIAHSKVSGLDLSTGLPTEITVTSEELREALAPTAESFAEAVKSAVEAVPSELLGDILEDGILLTGGGALIDGCAKRLKLDTDMKIFTAPEGDHCVINGLAAILENIDRMPKDAYTIYQG